MYKKDLVLLLVCTERVIYLYHVTKVWKSISMFAAWKPMSSASVGRTKWRKSMLNAKNGSFTSVRESCPSPLGDTHKGWSLGTPPPPPPPAWGCLGNESEHSRWCRAKLQMSSVSWIHPLGIILADESQILPRISIVLRNSLWSFIDTAVHYATGVSVLGWIKDNSVHILGNVVFCCQSKWSGDAPSPRHKWHEAPLIAYNFSAETIQTQL